MLQSPIIGTVRLREMTELTDATINTALSRLQNLDIIEETAGNKRNRLFCYHSYLNILNCEMNLPE